MADTQQPTNPEPVAQVTAQPIVQKQSSSKTPMIAMGCFLLLFLCFGLSYAFGSFYLNDDCKYIGPLASVPEDSPCFEEDEDSYFIDDAKYYRNSSNSEDEDDAEENSDDIWPEIEGFLEPYDNPSTYPVEATRKNTKTFETSDYSFEYSTDLFLLDKDSDGNIFVKSIDPEKQKASEFNDNIFLSEESSFTEADLSYSNCSTSAESTATSVASSYDNPVVDDVKLSTINGHDVCEFTISGTLDGDKLTQDVFIFPTEFESYVFILTALDGSKSYDLLMDVAESFEIKD